MPAGATRRFSAVRWGVAGNIVAAWLLTLPAAGLVAAWLLTLPAAGLVAAWLLTLPAAGLVAAALYWPVSWIF